MKIINLYAENLKRLTVVQITPEGNLVQITGRNGQGKTSVLDAIWWALDGAKKIQSTPIRKGEERAIIRLDLGDIKVTRRFNAQEDGSYTTSITVENGEGARFSSPQSMLDNLLGELTFDPLAFTRMKDADQVMAMRSLVPDFDFDQADADNKRDFATRTEENRRAKADRASAEAIKLPDVIPERVVFSDLSREWNEANLKNSERDNEIKRRGGITNQREILRSQIADFEDQLMDMRSREASLTENINGFSDLPDAINIDSIRSKMDHAEATNRIVNQAETRARFLSAAEEAEEKAERLTDSINRRKAAAKEAIEKSDMPVNGLTIEDGSVYLDGVPLNQASDAQQLQVSISIAMALNPKLKVIRVRDGSLLDDDAMNTLVAMADEHDYQIWIERVDSSGEIGFVLEDGHLKGQDLTPAKPEPKPEPTKHSIPTKVMPSLFDGDAS